MTQVFDTAVAAPRATRPVAASPAAHQRRPLFGQLFAGFSKAARAERAEIEALAELGFDVLAGRAILSKLRGEKAERHLKGLDVIECRGQRLLEILKIREGLGARSPWKPTPLERLTRTQPNTPAGRRQRAWLELLERRGLIRRMRERIEKPWAG
jgi:hypothetical protein